MAKSARVKHAPTPSLHITTEPSDAPLPLGRFRPDPWPALPARAAPARPAFDELVALA
jgi:hypothetical protein